MIAAIEAVKNGQGVSNAAKLHNVPRLTLQDRITGNVIHSRNPGPKPYLTSTEEGELSDFIVTTCNAGYGKTRAEVKMITEQACRSKEDE